MYFHYSTEDLFDSSVVTYPSISICVGSGEKFNLNQPNKFHENSQTNLDNYPLVQVDFTMLDEKNSAYDPRDDHRLHVKPNDIKENTTLGVMFQTQSVYIIPVSYDGEKVYQVMNCITFDPPTPVECGTEHQVQRDTWRSLFFCISVFSF